MHLKFRNIVCVLIIVNISDIYYFYFMFKKIYVFFKIWKYLIYYKALKLLSSYFFTSMAERFKDSENIRALKLIYGRLV